MALSAQRLIETAPQRRRVSKPDHRCLCRHSACVILCRSAGSFPHRIIDVSAQGLRIPISVGCAKSLGGAKALQSAPKASRRPPRKNTLRWVHICIRCIQGLSMKLDAYFVNVSTIYQRTDVQLDKSCHLRPFNSRLSNPSNVLQAL